MSQSAQNPEAILQRLEWTVIRRLDGLLQGDYRTLFRGFGLDLAELREYQFGDDVRYIDWNVTARMQTPYVRQYNEDREVTAWFLLDLSPSVDFGSGGEEALRPIDFVTVLARLLSRHGNPVGALFYGDRVDTVIPARAAGAMSCTSSPDAVPARASALGRDEPKDLLQTARQVMPRRSLVFVVSDFISAPGWEAPLAHLARRHEIVAVRLYDPLEMELPDLGLLVIQDAETGEQVWVDTHDRGFRERFPEAAAAPRERAALGAWRRRRGRPGAVHGRQLSSDSSVRRPAQAATAGAAGGSLPRAPGRQP